VIGETPTAASAIHTMPEGRGDEMSRGEAVFCLFFMLAGFIAFLVYFKAIDIGRRDCISKLTAQKEVAAARKCVKSLSLECE